MAHHQMVADNADGEENVSFDEFMNDLKALPVELAETLSPANFNVPGYPWWSPGDFNAFFALWGDNLATQLGLIAPLGMISASPFIVPHWPVAFNFTHILPGVGVSLFIGNFFYSMQAAKVARKTGNMDTCAQPYGINTPGAFAKTFGILVPVYAGLMNAELTKYIDSGDCQQGPAAFCSQLAAKGPEFADEAWRVAVAANFLSAVLELFGAFFAPVLSRIMHPSVLLVPLVGIGLSWLFLNPLIGMVSHDPLVGLIPFALIWFGFVSNVQPPFGIPWGMLAIIVGTFFGWLPITLEENGHALRTPAGIWGTLADDWTTGANQYLGLKLGTVGACFSHLGKVGPYFNILLPIALTNALGSLQCVCSAKQNGDVYSPVETMVADGIGSMVGAICGSPYGTTVYIGHPAYKKMGATRGYSLLNGVLYLIMGWSGLHALLDAVIPHEAVLGIIAFVGLSIASQAAELTPPRWYPAFFCGIVIAFTDWALVTLLDPISGHEGYLQTRANVAYLSSGFLFISLFYMLGLTTMTDRKFMKAATVWFICAICSSIGLVHSTRLGQFSTIEGKPGSGMPGWKFTLAYLALASICLICHVLQQQGKVEPEISSSDNRGRFSIAARGNEPARVSQ